MTDTVGRLVIDLVKTVRYYSFILYYAIRQQKHIKKQQVHKPKTSTHYVQSKSNFQSINQNIFIAPYMYVASESEAHKWQRLGRVFTFTVSNVK